MGMVGRPVKTLVGMAKALWPCLRRMDSFPPVHVFRGLLIETRRTG